MSGLEDLPTGSSTLDRSHSPSFCFSTLSTLAGKSSLGMMSATEAMVFVFVGAAKRVAGARAKMRLMVFVKIIVGEAR